MRRSNYRMSVLLDTSLIARASRVAGHNRGVGAALHNGIAASS
jgi:hypothetical protein